jgi:hypothetical protein
MRSFKVEITKYTVCSLIMLGLMACNQSHTSTEKNVVVNNDTVSKLEIDVHKADTVLQTKASVLLMKMRGSEPGWYGEVYSDHLRLLLDYGKDSASIAHNFDSSLSTKGYVASLCIAQTHKLKQQDVSLTLDITSKSCLESASGDTRERTVNLVFNKKTYKGCGEIVSGK